MGFSGTFLEILVARDYGLLPLDRPSITEFVGLIPQEESSK
jgi:hypothetical protein